MAEVAKPPVTPVEKVSIGAAVEKVNFLQKLHIQDKQPCIEALSLPVQYQTNFDTNFVDKDAFVSGVAKYIEEATVHANLSKILEEGHEYAVMVYTWRCCSRALPQVKSNDQPNRREIYEKVSEVLEPQISKLRNFMHFKHRAIAAFSGEIKRLCHAEKRNDFVSEAYLLTLGKLINMFAVLDELKNMKASIRNDHSHYRRATQFLQKVGNEAAIQESQNLSVFLATTHQIRDSLKESLTIIPGYEELLADIVNICVQMFENKMYLGPSEKNMLVKVMALSLFMMDNKENSIYKMDQRKRINISKIDKILKQLEIVPLYGDMQVAPYEFIKSSVNFDPSRWPSCESSHVSSQCNILSKLNLIREEHQSYVSELADQTNGKLTKSDGENRDLYTLALRGLHLLSSWTQVVTELYSWKLLNPTDHNENPTCPQTADDYEKATRYNYSSREKFALVEVIAMIKGLQSMMLKKELILKDAVKRHIYAELQHFVQKTLREPLRKSVKKKHDTIKVIMMSVRNTCADWSKGQEPKDDPCLKGKKDPADGYQIKMSRRTAGPSSTQLYMVRTMLESLLTEKSGTAKKALRKDIDSQYLRTIETLHKNSFFWSYLLNYNESLQNICDLSQLWYREYYLEMTMGGRVQFPIEMSMPWILTDHILEEKEPSMMEYLLYPMDLYNDSALFALTRFHQQYLYDEVEAEVNLCFDQFVYKVSEQIFAYYKQLAGSILLGSVSPYNDGPSQNKDCPSSSRYQTLLRLKHIKILGRTIDLNKLIGQRIKAAILKSLDVAIAKFEGSELTGIMELEGLIMCNKLTHKLLSAYLHLDDFEGILREANASVTVPYGRITLHVFWELNFDFLPCFCYNAAYNRFVRYKSVIPLCEPCERDKVPSPPPAYLWGTKPLAETYNRIYSQYSGFVGMDHFRAIFRLLGYQGIAVLLQELLKVIGEQLKGPILRYVTTLMKVMPPVCKLPLFAYMSTGVMAFYQAQLKELIQYPDLKMEVFQIFREIGNAILFCLLLEQAMTQEEVCDLKQAGPFQNNIPRPYMPVREGDIRKAKEEELKAHIQELEAKYSALQTVPVCEKLGTTEHHEIAKEGDLLTREKLCCGLHLFEAVLKKIRSFLEDPVWYGNPPANGLFNVDECSEFHRLWSAIQFAFCIPVGANEYTIEQLFGEGLNWAGCTLIVLLGQYRRFETLDFCNHLLKVNRVDMKTENVGGIPLAGMVSRIRRFQFLNNQIFAVLNRYAGTNEAENVKHFDPPQPPEQPKATESDEQTFV